MCGCGCACTRVRKRVRGCVCVCVYVCAYGCGCVCVGVCVCVWAWVSVCRWAFIAWAWERARTFVTSKSDSWNKNQPGKKYLRLLELNLKYWQSFGNFPRFYHNWIGCNLSLMPLNFLISSLFLIRSEMFWVLCPRLCGLSFLLIICLHTLYPEATQCLEYCPQPSIPYLGWNKSKFFWDSVANLYRAAEHSSTLTSSCKGRLKQSIPEYSKPSLSYLKELKFQAAAV